MLLLLLFFLLGGAGMAQWGEHSPPTIVARVRFPYVASYVGWVFWFSALHREVFSGNPSVQKPAFYLIVLIVNFSLQCSQWVLQRLNDYRHLNKVPFLIGWRIVWLIDWAGEYVIVCSNARHWPLLCSLHKPPFRFLRARFIKVSNMSRNALNDKNGKVAKYCHQFWRMRRFWILAKYYRNCQTLKRPRSFLGSDFGKFGNSGKYRTPRTNS